MRRASGGGIGMIVLLFVGYLLLKSCAGIDLGQIVAGGPGTGLDAPVERRIDPGTNIGSGTGANTGTGVAGDETDAFLSTILAETEDTWNRIFRDQLNAEYDEPVLNRFANSAPTGCGTGSAATGPFYCPADEDIYIDPTFFRTLARRFQAGGDFAQAYVIAHEVGHHVQQELGILGKFNAMRSRLSQREANAMSVRVELQADCFAGIWAADARNKGLLEEGDLEEAVNAAMQIGDDAIQERTQGYSDPHTFNHGTSEQRRAAFLAGFQSGGDLRACDTNIFG